MRRGRHSHQIQRQAGAGEISNHRAVVVVDRAKTDRHVRITDVDDRIARPRVATGPAPDGAAGHEVRLPNDPVERLMRMAEAEQVVRLVAGDPRQDCLLYTSPSPRDS